MQRLFLLAACAALFVVGCGGGDEKKDPKKDADKTEMKKDGDKTEKKDMEKKEASDKK